MNFDFSDDQKMLKDQARKFLDDTCTLDHVRKILEGDAGHDDAVWKGLCDLGFAGAAVPEEFGGQGLPMSLALVQSEAIACANFSWLMFSGLSKGAINTILAHGADELKQKWLPPLVSGEFTGTMCLTEPQARTLHATTAPCLSPNPSRGSARASC